MKKQTKKDIYRKLKNTDELRDLHFRAKTSIYRQSYHIQPVTGLLNDPNGLIYHNDTWHLFYQWCPWGPVHGIKYWYHVTSTDLINWTNCGVAIRPDTYFDNAGVFSGTAYESDGNIYLYYTGIHLDPPSKAQESPEAIEPYTCHAKCLPDGRIQKYSAPLFGPNLEFTHNQRDPQLIYDKKTRKYYIILGAETHDHKGCILIYESNDKQFDWKYKGRLNIPDFENFGYMWECPSLMHIGTHDVLIFCPQGIQMDGYGDQSSFNGYIIGTMDFDKLTFTPDGAFHLLDFGFDSYAAQSVNSPTNPERAILMAWMGLPATSYPTDEDTWSGTMTLPRELAVRHRRLIQRPHPGLRALRGDLVNPSLGILPSSAEINISLYPKNFDLKLFSNADGSGGFNILYNSTERTITIDRSQMSKHFNTSYGEIRTRTLESELTHLRIFIDSSSIEIFINDGDAVFTSRIFPESYERYFHISECTSINIWELKSGVNDDLIL